MTTLVALLQRAATIPAPFNTQDAVLLIRALGTLRLARPEVRAVAEKASFALASSPAEVPTPVLIDAVHHLTALQSAQLPVVQRVLLKRFCELPLPLSSPASSLAAASSASQQPPDPRTVQKAALTLAKMGRHAGHAGATEHVLRLAHAALAQRPDDAALHVVYVALYASSARYTAQPQWWRTPAEQRRFSVQTLQRSLAHLLRRHSVYEEAAGNLAWQLLHLLVLLPPLTETKELAGFCSSEVKEPPLCPDDVARYEAWARTGAFAQRVSSGAYVQFVHAFAADLCRLDLRRFIAVLRPLRSWVGAAAASSEAAPSDASKRLNVYDQTKLAGALTDALQALASHPARPPAGAWGPRGANTPEGVEASGSDVTLDSPHMQRDWVAALQLCCALLHVLVAMELEGVGHAPSDAAHSFETIAHPDPFLVAALLNAAAVLATDVLGGAPRGAFDVAALLPDACVTALAELVGLLSGAPPSLMSWTLRSLAALRRSVTAALAPALERGADVLVWQYCSAPSTQRSIRADVEVVYAYACFADAGGWSEGRGLPNAADEGHATVGHGSTSLTSRPLCGTALSALSTLDPVLRSLASRLRPGGAGAERTTAEDADMLLAALYHLIPADADPVVPPLLDDLVASLAAHLASGVEAAASKVESTSDVVMRAARLQVLVARLAEAHLLRPATAAVLTTAAEGAVCNVTSCVANAAPGDGSRIDSATVLRALGMLGRRLPHRAHTSTPSSLATPSAAEGNAACRLLSVVCTAYQQHIDDVAAQGAPADVRLPQVVHVLWRARQTGVQVLFTDAEHAVADSNDIADGGLCAGSVPPPRLYVPLRVCRVALLGCTAAADVLLLLAEAQLSPVAGSMTSVAQRLPPHVVLQLRNELLDRLQSTGDAAGVVLLVQLSETLAVSRLVFPDKDGLNRLSRCVEETAKSLVLAVAHETAEDAAARNRREGPLAVTRRLLYALIRSQLFVRLSSMDAAEQERLRSAVQLLAQQLEDSSRPADVVAVMKARLLSSGIL